MPTVEGTEITAKTTDTYSAFTHVLTAPCRLVGFDVPAGATIYASRTGELKQCIMPSATVLGGTKLARKARIADERGQWLMGGFLGRKVVQGGLSLASGAVVRVRPDGTVMVTFSPQGMVLDGVKLLESTRLNWTGTAWVAEVDGEYVPGSDESEDDSDDDDVIIDEGDDDDDDDT